MTQEKLREALKAKVVDGKVTCRAMLQLAESFGVDPAEVGRLCDETKVKITACQLGCFR